jgi:hypothetical protein
VRCSAGWKKRERSDFPEVRISRAIEYENYGQPQIQLTVSALNTLPSIPAEYRQWVENDCRDVMPFGMEKTKQLSMHLRHVYVPALVDRSGQQEPQGGLCVSE